MTIALRSSATKAATANGATVALTIPAAVAGDVLVAWAALAGAASWTASGGGLASSPDVVSSGTNRELAVWVHPLASGDLGQTITFTAAVSGHAGAAGCLVLSGAGGLDVSGVANGNSNSADCPGVTTTRDHDALITIAMEQANTTRTWTGWSGSTVGPKDGTGSLGAGGIEFACFYKLDQGTHAATGTLSEGISTSSGWAGVTLAIQVASGSSTVDVGTGQDLAATAGMTVRLGKTVAGTSNNLWYAKSSGAWGVLVPKTANTDGTWS